MIFKEEKPMFAQKRLLCQALILTVVVMALAACASAAPVAQAPAAEPEVIEKVVEKEVIVEVTRSPAQVVRFVFAPDPLLKYMQDTGIVAKYEEQYNMKLTTVSTWDEVAFFGGGHADIASTGDYEVTALVEETGEEFVVFGLYNMSRVPIWVKTDSPYQSIQDLKGKKIGVPGPLSSTMIWGVMLAETEGVDFRVGSDEFDLIVNSHAVNGQLFREGEIEAGIIVPEAVLPEIADGSIRPLYGAGGGWEYYRDHLDPEKKHKGVPSNIFLARKAWFDANPEAVEFFLAMWEEGLKAWKANLADIVRLYPEDHGLDPEAETFDRDLEVMTKWLQDHDWFAETIYLDETWIEKERPLFDLMRKNGFMEESQADPNFVAVAPPAN
jgi:ABC-type nitrate/sulfonate/bicarbonate transport system substrate-binding protein